MEDNTVGQLDLLKADLKKKVAKNIDEVQLILEKELSPDSELHTEYIICKNKIQLLESNTQKGVLSTEDQSIQHARNLNSILSIINRLRYPDLISSTKTKVTSINKYKVNNTNATNGILNFKKLIYGLLILTISIMLISHYTNDQPEVNKTSLTAVENNSNSINSDSLIPPLVLNHLIPTQIETKEIKKKNAANKPIRKLINLNFSSSDKALEQIAKEIIQAQLLALNITIKSKNAIGENSKILNCVISHTKEEIEYGILPAYSVSFKLSLQLYDEFKNIIGVKKTGSKNFTIYDEKEIIPVFNNWLEESRQIILPPKIDHII